jgi:DNA-binding NtrC family response regulator
MVLLIDDDDEFRDALAAMLSDDGRTVWDFSRPGDVPDLERCRDVSAVVLDYEMAGENGLEFADRFHAVHPRVPVLMVTASCGGNLDAEVAKRGYMTMCRKPIDYDDLTRLLPSS